MNKLIILASLVSFIVVGAFGNISVGASAQDIVCERLPSGQQEECLQQADASFGDFVSSVVNVLSWAVGIISVIALIIGGLMYVVSAGNPDTAKKGKNTIIYALVGVVVAFFAQVIVQFVLSSV